MNSADTPTEAASHNRIRARASTLRASFRVVALLGLCVLLLSCWIIAKVTASNEKRLYALAARWTHRWARWCRWAAGIHVRVHGQPPVPGSFIAPNHLGYADVLAVGSATACFFVAKADVESWPFIGALLRISHNIGVPRSRAKSLVDVNASIAKRLQYGQSVCVFLEGTSTGGDRLLPFYSPLVQSALEAACPVVPVALRWSAEDPEVDVAEDIAYWKDHTFGPHAWRLLGLKGVRCDVTFGDALMPTEHTRKTLAAALHEGVSRLTALGVANNSGRGNVRATHAG